ncbi:MAG TPA: glycoside hydrolase domain-containing protein [Acidimicrobiales bacterium]|nr:glycoside hydrolase domain-containing protein [Acidimicrobiales bacterium]
MTMTWPCVLDWSYADLSAQAVLDYGAVGAMRYLGHDGRCITGAERDEMLSHGVGIGLIYETSARRPLEGYSAGLTDALTANDLADELGAPGSVPIFYAVDFQPTSGELVGPITDYFRGAIEAYGREVANYGCAAVVDHLHRTFAQMTSWQCAAWSYPGTAPGTPISDGGWNLILSPYACMLQNIGYVLGDSADHNSLQTAPHWLWGFEEEDVPLNQADMDAIAHTVQGIVDTALANHYTGARAVRVAGEHDTYELVTVDGRLVRRKIPSIPEIEMLQSVDYFAGTGDGTIREISYPSHIDAFRALPVVE